MKKLFLFILLVMIYSFLSAQGVVIRADLASHWRMASTANIELGFLTKKRNLEYYLSFDRAYPILGKNEQQKEFYPSNDNVNLEYGAGMRYYLTNNRNKYASLFIFGECEYAKLFYKHEVSQGEYISGGFWYPDEWVPNGIKEFYSINFDRTQLTAGIGVHFSTKSRWGFDVSLSYWRTYHKNISKYHEKNTLPSGETIWGSSSKIEKSFDIDFLTEHFGASDPNITNGRKFKEGPQLAIQVSYTFGSKVIRLPKLVKPPKEKIIKKDIKKTKATSQIQLV